MGSDEKMTLGHTDTSSPSKNSQARLRDLDAMHGSSANATTCNQAKLEVIVWGCDGNVVRCWKRRGTQEGGRAPVLAKYNGTESLLVLAR
ncbi:hypothetical protein CFE70_007619 [Pyrenophora teres f. teres 0-1]